MKVLNAKTSTVFNSARDFCNGFEIMCMKGEADSIECITLQDVSKLHQLYDYLQSANKFKSIRGTIRVSFKNIENVDLSFVGIVCFFRKEFPSIRWVLDFKHRHAELKSNLIYSLKAMLQSGYEFNRHFFPKIKDVDAFVLFEDNKKLKSDLLGYSRLLPFICVDPQNVDVLFNSTIDWDEVIKEVISLTEFDHHFFVVRGKSTYANTIYQALRKSVDRNAAQKRGYDVVVVLQYLRLLRDLDILQFEIVKIFPTSCKALDTIRVQNTKYVKNGVGPRPELRGENGKWNKAYVDFLQSKIYEAKEQPLVFMLLLSIVMQNVTHKRISRESDSTIQGFKKNLEHSLADYKKSIVCIYEFNKTLFAGLKEIALNIVEHSTNKRGILLARVFSKSDIEGITSPPVYQTNEYLCELWELLRKDKNRIGFSSEDFISMEFLDIMVYDDGTDGVIKKILENLYNFYNSNKDDKHAEFFKEDIERIRRREVTFEHLFKTGSTPLYHQAKRSAAHLGLLIFSKLIQNNRGYFLSSSKTYDTSKQMADHVIKFNNNVFSFKNGDVETDAFFRTGTLYNIILPLDKERYPSPEYQAETEGLGSHEQLANVNELFDFKLIKPEKNIDVSKLDKKGLVDIDIVDEQAILPGKENTGSKDWLIHEAIKTVCEVIDSFRGVGKQIIPVLNLEKSKIGKDVSLFYRFLGGLQLDRNERAIIVYNVSSEFAKEVLSIAQDLSISEDDFKGGSPSFWSDSNYVLIYSYQQLGQDRIYFTDLLGGYTVDDYRWVNNRVSHTHFSLHESTGHQVSKPSRQMSFGLSKNPLIENSGNRVHNFELLIESNGLSLFEHSAKTLLNTPLNFSHDIE